MSSAELNQAVVDVLEAMDQDRQFNPLSKILGLSHAFPGAYEMWFQSLQSPDSPCGTSYGSLLQKNSRIDSLL